MTTPVCINCKFCIRRVNEVDELLEYYCTEPRTNPVVDIVTGETKYSTCRHIRTTSNCGMNGSWFVKQKTFGVW